MFNFEAMFYYLDVLGSSPELKGQAYTNEGHVSVEETSLSPLKSRQLTLAKKVAIDDYLVRQVRLSHLLGDASYV